MLRRLCGSWSRDRAVSSGEPCVPLSVSTTMTWSELCVVRSDKVSSPFAGISRPARLILGASKELTRWSILPGPA